MDRRLREKTEKLNCENSPEILQDILATLVQYDGANNGFLDKVELRRFLDDFRVNIGMPPCDIAIFNRIINLFATKGNKDQIQFDNILNGIDYLIIIIIDPGKEIEKLVRLIFKDFDIDNSGFLEKTEFRQLCDIQCDKMKVDRCEDWQVDYIMNLIDYNGNGYVTEKELLANYCIVNTELKKNPLITDNKSRHNKSSEIEMVNKSYFKGESRRGSLSGNKINPEILNGFEKIHNPVNTFALGQMATRYLKERRYFEKFGGDLQESQFLDSFAEKEMNYPESVIEFERLFYMYDEFEKGELGKKELFYLLKDVRDTLDLKRATLDQLDRMAAVQDKDGNGAVDFEEFTNYQPEIVPIFVELDTDTIKMITDSFHDFDVDKSGSIDRKEMKLLMDTTCDKLNAKRLNNTQFDFTLKSLFIEEPVDISLEELLSCYTLIYQQIFTNNKKVNRSRGRQNNSSSSDLPDQSHAIKYKGLEILKEKALNHMKEITNKKAHVKNSKTREITKTNHISDVQDPNQKNAKKQEAIPNIINDKRATDLLKKEFLNNQYVRKKESETTVGFDYKLDETGNLVLTEELSSTNQIPIKLSMEIDKEIEDQLNKEIMANASHKKKDDLEGIDIAKLKKTLSPIRLKHPRSQNNSLVDQKNRLGEFCKGNISSPKLAHFNNTKKALSITLDQNDPKSIAIHGDQSPGQKIGYGCGITNRQLMNDIENGYNDISTKRLVKIETGESQLLKKIGDYGRIAEHPLHKLVTFDSHNLSHLPNKYEEKVFSKNAENISPEKKVMIKIDHTLPSVLNSKHQTSPRKNEVNIKRPGSSTSLDSERKNPAQKVVGFQAMSGKNPSLQKLEQYQPRKQANKSKTCIHDNVSVKTNLANQSLDMNRQNFKTNKKIVKQIIEEYAEIELANDQKAFFNEFSIIEDNNIIRHIKDIIDNYENFFVKMQKFMNDIEEFLNNKSEDKDIKENYFSDQNLLSGLSQLKIYCDGIIDNEALKLTDSCRRSLISLDQEHTSPPKAKSLANISPPQRLGTLPEKNLKLGFGLSKFLPTKKEGIFSQLYSPGPNRYNLNDRTHGTPLNMDEQHYYKHGNTNRNHMDHLYVKPYVPERADITSKMKTMQVLQQDPQKSSK